MKNYNCRGLSMVFCFSLLFFAAKAQQPSVSIIPKPVQLEEKKGSFQLNEQSVITYPSNQPQLKELANYTVAMVQELSHKTLKVQPIPSKVPVGPNKIKKEKTIVLSLDPTLKLGKEGYTLNVSTQSINIKAKTTNGLFYGIQTLQQLFPVSKSTHIPCVSISDEPRFSWRGMMFDVCRHKFSVPFIKKFIDQLAYHKLNKLHLHLTEDQGWRIEIKKYPRLQEVAAWRNGTQIGPNRQKDVDTLRYGGYFTQNDIKDIVAYATSRYVEVIPEIEMPGHSVAAVTAYPYLGCFPQSFETGKPHEVRKVWGVSKDLYCAGNDSVFTFIKDVLTEVMPLFPSQYIHIGGDEAPHDAWKKCPKCQKRMKDEGLKNEAELQSWFIRRIEKFLNANGKHLVGWEEIMQGGLTQNATVHSWLGVESGLKAAQSGHDAIMSPYSHLYFDGYQADAKIEPMAIGYWTPLDTVYAFNPVHPALNEQEAKHILGAQANLWTEFIGTEDYFEYMVFPRISALAEIDWTPLAQKDFKDFKQRLKAQYQRYDNKGIKYRVPTPELSTETANENVKVTLKDPLGGGTIRYAINGNEVNESSTVYTGPLTLKTGDLVRFALFTDNGRKSSTDFFPKSIKKKK